VKVERYFDDKGVLLLEVEYWENGKKSRETTTEKDDDGNATTLYYYENTLMMTEKGKIKNGKAEGEWRGYRSDGMFWRTINYRYGLEHGYTTWYDESGNVAEKFYCYNGVKKATHHYENGKLVSIDDHNDKGHVILTTYYDTNGKYVRTEHK
jgi:antitoxin component YwqK of YwqJK toxin-antitoxin module